MLGFGYDEAAGPAECPMGHYLGPSSVMTGWMPCGCPPALEAGLLGHRYWWCVHCDQSDPRCRTWCYVPPHVADMEPFRFVNRRVPT